MEYFKKEHLGYCHYRYNAWDKISLGLETYEVSSLQIKDSSFLNELERYLISEKHADLILAQSCASDFELRSQLTMNNYLPVCAVYTLICSTQKIKKSTSQIKDTFVAEINDKNEVLDIFSNSFTFSRFHEDPYVSQELAKKRYFLWGEQLLRERKILVTKSNSGAITSLLSTTPQGTNIDLTLFALNQSSKGFGYFILLPLIKNITADYKSVTAKVSIANLKMLRLYQKIGFELQKCEFYFHKHLHKKKRPK